MTQNRQGRNGTHASDQNWNENQNRSNDQGYRSQSWSHEDDTQRNAQGSSPRWNQTSGFQGDSNAGGYNESNYEQRSNYGDGNYAGRQWGSGSQENQRNEWNDRFRTNRYGDQEPSGRSNRNTQNWQQDDDARYNNWQNENTSRGMYGNDYGQGQYGSQMGRDYTRNNSGYSQQGGNNSMNQGNNGSGSNSGMRNHGFGNYGSGNQWGNSDSNMGINRQGSLFGSHKGKGPKGYQRSDDRIKEDISDRLSDDSMIDASDITVEVENGVASLSGTVDSRDIKHRAEDLAESVSGVSNVENRLSVQRDNTMENRNASSTSSAAGNEHKNKRNAMSNSHS